MVPVSSAASSDMSPSEAKAEVPDSAGAAQPPGKSLSPQERNNQKLQQQLAQSIGEALPANTNANRNGLIASLAPANNGKALTIRLDSGWYQLEPGEQEAIATALWSQRDDLKFQQLTLKDLQGKTIARNPVVGDQMVILRR